jgi:uncharacterized protein (DUF488 family)
MRPLVYTVGHSTRSAIEFVALLCEYGIALVADVRSVPHSAHNPQFDIVALQQSLPDSGIRYLHFTGLGGFRHTSPDSPNTGWRNESFRAYADYMQTEAFAESLRALIVEALAAPTAIMCAEAVPWRCHRSLIADALVVRGIDVVDIIGRSSARRHALTPFAKVEGDVITYPAPGSSR